MRTIISSYVNETDDWVEDCWDLLERCWPLYAKLCRTAVARAGYEPALRQDLVDELMGEVVDRVPRIVDVWDPCQEPCVPLRPYVITSLRWYLHKWMQRYVRDAGRVVSLDSTLDHDHKPMDCQLPCPNGERDVATRYTLEETDALLSSLTDDERELVRMRFMEGMTVIEMCEALGIGRRGMTRELALVIAKLRGSQANDR